MIEFWFDFDSPYTYFAARSIDALAERHGREVVWRPFLLGVVLKRTGMTPLTTTPLRGDYARRDWQRLARLAGIPFKLPSDHPASTLPAARTYYWLEERDRAAAAEFARRALEARFTEALALCDPATVVGIAAACGADRDALLRDLDTEPVKQALRTRTQEALDKGVFGAPFILVDGEPFWGADRLGMVEEWLRRGGW